MPYRDYADVEYDKIKNTTPSIYVTDIVEFPTIQKTGDLKNTDEEIKLFRETVKKHIMKYGSVYSSIQSPSDISYSGLDNMNVFFTNGVSTDAERHAVSIIGWDDNYSKDNFKTELMNGEIATPKNDGAYIALNSWGVKYHDEGVFYISYEDIMVEANMGGVISTALEKGSVKNSYEVVTFDDKNLYEAMKKNTEYELYDDSKLELKYQKNKIDDISYITIGSNEIKSLKGIEKYTNLKSINILENNIEDISPLFEIKGLTEISITKNKITSIQGINKLDNLININITENNILKGLDELAELKNLYILNLKNCNLDDKCMEYISKIESLSVLDISKNNIKDLSAIENNKNLYQLQASYNPIEKIGKSVSVTDVNFSNCNLEKIDEVVNLENVLNLNLSNNKISDISKISKLNKLKSINISYNKDIKGIENIRFNDSNDEYYRNVLNIKGCNLSDISSLKNVGSIKILYISENPIKNFDPLLDIKGLVVLDISDIDVGENIEVISKLTNLYSLSARNCNLGDISKLSLIKNLTNLDVSYNENLKNFENIKSIYSLIITNCKLNDISNIKNLKELISLNISNNNIKQLPNVSYFQEGVTISAYGNEIENVSEWYYENIKSKKNINLFYDNNIEIDYDISIPDYNSKILYTDDTLSNILKRYKFSNNSFVKVNGEKCYLNSDYTGIIVDNTEKLDKCEIELKVSKEVSYLNNIKIIFNINHDAKLNEINILMKKNKKFLAGEKVTKNDINVRAKYQNGEFYIDDYEITVDQLEEGENNIEITYNGLSTRMQIIAFDNNEIEKIKVEDPYILTYLAETIGYDYIYNIDYPEYELRIGKNTIENFKKINVSNDYILKSINGFKNFYNLEEIIIENATKIKDISGLEVLKKLNKLEIYGCYLTTMGKLIDNKNMSIVLSTYIKDYFKGNTTPIQDNENKNRIYLPDYLYDFAEKYNMEDSISVDLLSRVETKHFDVVYDKLLKKAYFEIDESLRKENTMVTVLIKIKDGILKNSELRVEKMY